MPAARRCRRRRWRRPAASDLAEPAPGVRGRLIARFAPNTKIRVRSLDDLRKMEEKSVDLAVMNSVAQYMTPDELDAALAVIRRLLKPGGRLILGDILRPEVGMLRDVLALLRFALTPRLPEGRADRADQHRAVGLPAVALARRPAALQRNRDHREARGGRHSPPRAPMPISATILAHDLRRAARVLIPSCRSFILVQIQAGPPLPAMQRHYLCGSNGRKCRLTGPLRPFAAAKSGLKTTRARGQTWRLARGTRGMRALFCAQFPARET